MSEETTPPEVPATPERKPLPQWARMAVVAGVVLLLFALLVWSQGCESDRAKGALFAQSADALAAALATPVLETGSVRFENRGQRLQSIVESVAREGKYEAVIVTDAAGSVLATSDSRFKDQRLAEIAKAKRPAVTTTSEGSRQADAVIAAPAGQPIGYLRVRARF